MTTAANETRALPRLKQRYREEIIPAMQGEFTYANIMEVPGLT
jgi:large subunit ribosomal protein L5